MAEKVYEFTFMCVQAAETYEEALEAALQYLYEQPVEPTAWRELGQSEYEEVSNA
jgi:hypothetical protein